MIDLRSDTVTRPTPEMRRAMAEAEVGDDVYGEDPSVNRLQELAASLLGFEAALFVPSGVMGNEIAIRILTRPGQEVLAEERSHVVQYELAGMAALSGVMPRTVASPDGILTPQRSAPRSSPGCTTVRTSAWPCSRTPTTSRAGRSTTPRRRRRRSPPAARPGSRCTSMGRGSGTPLWRSAAQPRALAAGADTLMVTLSKGLCAPVGSLLLASHERIQEARRVRKQLGGGMRQAGILAAAGHRGAGDDDPAPGGGPRACAPAR